MTIRDSRREDYAALAKLMRFTHWLPSTEDTLAEGEAARNKDLPFMRKVVEKDGEIIAFCKSQRRDIPSPVRYVLAVAVEPEHRRQGIGNELHRIAEDHALESKAEYLWIQLVEGDEVGRRFAVQRGYSESFYLQDLTLDLPRFDFRLFEGIVEQVQASGIRFVPYSMLGDTVENRRKLYEINVAVERDVPNFGQDEFMTFKSWQTRTMDAKWFDPAGQFIAMDGDNWIGIGSVGQFFPGVYMNAITGVLREYRGRRIALALKLIGLEFARSRGAKQMYTQNHGTNEVMRAINARLGYQGQLGWFTYEKRV